MKNIFYNSYEESKKAFIERYDDIRKRWSNATLTQKNVVDNDENLTINTIQCDALTKKQNLIIITTGLHGIEGYVGSAMIQKFMDNQFYALNPANTGLAVVHPINPWGMKHFRRVNENNIDLNRNFIDDFETFNNSINIHYTKINDILNPDRKVKSKVVENIRFLSFLIKSIIRIGADNLKIAFSLGQYQYPKGVYYGGKSIQTATDYIINLLNKSFQDYSKIVFIDIHTGYGPRYQMSIVNSKYEEAGSQQMEKNFDYPLIQKANPEEFYSIEGDITDYSYKLIKEKFDVDDYYACAFEFGTIGDSLINGIKSIKAIKNENTFYHHNLQEGFTDKSIEKWVKDDFLDLFYPSQEKWREKAIQDFDKALTGILKHKMFI